LHNVELCDVFSQPDIIRVIPSRQRRYGMHGGQEKCVHGFGGET